MALPVAVNSNYSSHYDVVRLSDHKVIATGSITRVSSYNIAPTADYTTYVSMEDARKRGIIELAHAYRLRIAELLPTMANPHAGERKTDDSTPKIPELQPSLNNENIRQRF